jgi:alanyl-tRNA synthetase
MDISEHYKKYCESLGLKFTMDNKVNPYDDTTLFCPAGMQQFKKEFNSDATGTRSNIQTCIRLKDLDEIGDGTHFLSFNMMGLFSFRDWELQDAVDFWMNFLEKTINLKVDYVTIHPDKFEEWKELYSSYSVDIRMDDECIWTDGDIGGYCTEFYKDDIEIGNIVSPLGTCIDAGFGLERLQSFFSSDSPPSKEEILIDACEQILNSGYFPGNKEQGYILRKLLRELYKSGSSWGNSHYNKERLRQDKVIRRYFKNKDKKSYANKPREWWFDTMGVDLDFIDNLSPDNIAKIISKQ